MGYLPANSLVFAFVLVFLMLLDVPLPFRLSKKMCLKKLQIEEHCFE